MCRVDACLNGLCHLEREKSILGLNDDVESEKIDVYRPAEVIDI